MGHFRFHVGGAPLVHGSTAGIDQSGQRGRRVYIDPSRGRSHITEIRAAIPQLSGTSRTPEPYFTNGGLGIPWGDFLPDWTDLAGWTADQIEQAITGDPDVVNEGSAQNIFERCIWPAREDPVTGQCRVFAGDAVGPDVTGASMHENGHSDSMPATFSRTVRRCRRGSVLGKDGWCHPRRDIKNADREWPKARRPLGTAGDLNAVTKAKAFSTRLVNNQKSLKKTAANFAKASQYYRNSPGK